MGHNVNVAASVFINETKKRCAVIGLSADSELSKEHFYKEWVRRVFVLRDAQWRATLRKCSLPKWCAVMLIEISQEEVVESLASENPWWRGEDAGDRFRKMPRRSYFSGFHALVRQDEIRRAVILMGPRRVGKTVMLQQSIIDLVDSGVNPKNILYVSIDTPTYAGYPLERLLKLFLDKNEVGSGKAFVFFDEVQYLKDWEVHLKVLVDKYDNVKFTASGSAAAALRLASVESGAGRFTDFMLPPLTFSEYLKFTGSVDSLIEGREVGYHDQKRPQYFSKDIQSLNEHFVNYLNFGGYPEAVVLQAAQANPTRFIKSDIIEKVLLRDLPSLYGITNIQELNRLFTSIAYNTGNALSLEKLSQSSGVSKPTISRYLEYLEAAFLIMRVKRIDEKGNAFAREREFKVYLTNPSMRAALFHPVTSSSEAMGNLAETAIFSQWFHSDFVEFLHYARWKKSGRRKGVDEDFGEVDIVGVERGTLSPLWALEIKWSDRFYDHPNELTGLIEFAKRNNLKSVAATTITREGQCLVEGIEINFTPCALHCYRLAENCVASKLLGRRSE